MAHHTQIDSSPPILRGMTGKLDRDAFHKTINILAAQIPASKTTVLLRSKVLKHGILDLSRIQNVLHGPDETRIILLNYQTEDEIPLDAKQLLEENSATLIPRKVELTYDFWKTDDIMAAILPEDLVDEAPHGYTAIGHIAHLNLRDEYLPYKHVIGQVILDKDRRVRTVVNKLDVIQNQFRVFDMELLAGEPDYLVEHSESGCKFTFDFRKVYWNSRLHTEHARLIDMFSAEDVIADVFAGVGPFALPAGKKGCGVLANDLNPESYKYLQQNITQNSVQSHVRASCEDGKEFIRAVISRALDDPLPPAKPPMSKSQRAKLQKLARQNPTNTETPRASTPEPPSRKHISHFVMNLPDTAILFLGAFRGVLSPANAGGRDLSGIYAELPMVHCYCFTRDPEHAEVDIRERVEKELGHPLGGEVSYHHVRSVAPNKEMFCVSFRLPREVAFAQTEA